MTDSEIIEAFFRRSEDALNLLAAQYGRLMYGVASNMTGSPEDAAECYNDALFDVWNRIPPERPKSLGAFCASIVRRRGVDAVRRRTAQKRGGGKADAVWEELEECIPDSQTESDSAEIKEALDGFLEGQEKTQRIIFVLRYYYSMDISEIEQRTGKNKNYIAVSLYRSRAALKEYLTERGIGL